MLNDSFLNRIFFFWHRLDLLAINLQHTVDSLNEDIDTLENDLFAMREFSLEQASRIVKIDEELTTSNSELTQVKQENMELRASLRYMYNFDLT